MDSLNASTSGDGWLRGGLGPFVSNLMLRPAIPHPCGQFDFLLPILMLPLSAGQLSNHRQSKIGNPISFTPNPKGEYDFK